MKQFFVFCQMDAGIVKVATITAATAVDALRIAKQKNHPAPIIGDAK